MDNLCEVMNQYGITLQEVYEAIVHIPKIPFTEMDIVLIRNNPSLSVFQKWKLIREIKKNMVIE